MWEDAVFLSCYFFPDELSIFQSCFTYLQSVCFWVKPFYCILQMAMWRCAITDPLPLPRLLHLRSNKLYICLAWSTLIQSAAWYCPVWAQFFCEVLENSIFYAKSSSAVGQLASIVDFYVMPVLFVAFRLFRSSLISFHFRTFTWSISLSVRLFTACFLAPRHFDILKFIK